MALNDVLVSEFAKIIKTDKNAKSEKTVYGTIVEYNGSKYIQLDGSDLLTPADSTAKTEVGDRVTVMIKNHTATVTGNMTSPSASDSDVTIIGSELTAAKATISDLTADNVTIKDSLTAHDGYIKNLETENLTVKGRLDAAEADITNLEAENVTINGKLEATDADIDSLQADNVVIKQTLVAHSADIDNLEADNVTINNTLTAHKGYIDDLTANKLNVTDANITYANIDFSNIGKAAIEQFFATSGLIENVVVGEGTVTGELVGVTIKGDLIEGNTIVADKLVIKGTDGLYYKLNTDGVTTESEQTEYNSLNGSVITAKSITATKISVSDLVAFDATIGGFKITENSIYSGVKETVDNTTRGIYMDDDGQISFGDTNNYVMFYKDTDGTYKLTVSAQSIKMGSTNRDVEEAIDEAQESANDAQESANSNFTTISSAQLDIDAIKGILSAITTDENGTTLMEQTGSGWSFSLYDIQNSLNAATSNIDGLTSGLDATNSLIDTLNQSVTDLGEYTDYIKFGIDNGQPCIILGETDSPFKVVITNTDIRFMEGSMIPASISNQSLNIENAVVRGELRQGDFVWETRNNGHYCLTWKG